MGQLCWVRESYWQEGMREQATGFVADVWAARVLLTWQLGAAKATPTKIARWLTERGKGCGYTTGSLRVMVHRALRRIEVAEAAEPNPWIGWESWEPFDLEQWTEPQ